MKIARECQSRGHGVRIYAGRWEAQPRADFEVIEVPARGVTGHRRYARFAAWVLEHVRRHPVDLVVGMNKMPGLDVYYAGDSCYAEKASGQRNRLYRLLPRYRQFIRFERAVFDAGVGHRGPHPVGGSDRRFPQALRYSAGAFSSAAAGHRPGPPGAVGPGGAAEGVPQRIRHLRRRASAALPRLGVHQERAGSGAPGRQRAAGRPPREHASVRGRPRPRAAVSAHGSPAGHRRPGRFLRRA